MWKQLFLSFILSLFSSFVVFSQEPEVFVPADTSRAIILMKDVKRLITSNEMSQALENIRTARDIYSQILGEYDQNVAQTFHWEALHSYYNGDPDKAIANWKDAIEVWDRSLGANNLESSKAMNNIGGVLFEKGVYEEALQYMKKSLDVRLNVYGENSPENIDYVYNYAVMCRELNYYEEALENQLLTIDLYKKHKENDPNIVESYGEVATIYIRKEMYKEAKEYLDEGLILGERFQDAIALSKMYETTGFYYIYLKLSLIHI